MPDLPATAPPAQVAGSGTPVVLLHAFPLDGRMWQPQVEALGATGTYQVIVPDLRGFGEARDLAVEVADPSAPPPGPPPAGDLEDAAEPEVAEPSPPGPLPAADYLDLLADDVVALLDERGVDRVVLCGLSMGGYVAFALARRHPQRLGGLVLADTRATVDTDEARQARLAMAGRALDEGAGFVADALLPRLLGATTRRAQPELVERVRDLIDAQDPRGIAAAQRGMAARRDATDMLPTLDVPTLVLAGAEDELTGPDVARDLAGQVRDTRFLAIDSAGHLPNLEQPAAFNNALLDFLAPLWV